MFLLLLVVIVCWGEECSADDASPPKTKTFADLCGYDAWCDECQLVPCTAVTEIKSDLPTHLHVMVWLFEEQSMRVEFTRESFNTYSCWGGQCSYSVQFGNYVPNHSQNQGDVVHCLSIDKRPAVANIACFAYQYNNMHVVEMVNGLMTVMGGSYTVEPA